MERAYTEIFTVVLWGYSLWLRFKAGYYTRTPNTEPRMRPVFIPAVVISHRITIINSVTVPATNQKARVGADVMWVVLVYQMKLERWGQKC